uniref:Uncharacterized protein n=1 Tax=Rhizophora mucronata TaxID=61149 RepID=A0A2P2NWR4_RHIMU
MVRSIMTQKLRLSDRDYDYGSSC